MKQQAITAVAVLDEMIVENKNSPIDYSVDYRNALREAKSRIQELDLQSNNGWILVTERLPNDDEEYIICTSDGLVTSVAWSTDENNWIVGITNWRTDIFGKITHWQPLPLPPNK